MAKKGMWAKVFLSVILVFNFLYALSEIIVSEPGTQIAMSLFVIWTFLFGYFVWTYDLSKRNSKVKSPLKFFIFGFLAYQGFGVIIGIVASILLLL